MHDISLLVPQDSAIAVGCAKGVDLFFRQQYLNAHVFYAHEYGQGKSAFTLRSASCVDEVKRLNGLWISFPFRDCPDGVLPSPTVHKCFDGKGSGSWASLAYAIGQGVPAIAYLGPLQDSEEFTAYTFPDGWDLKSLTGEPGWYFSETTLF